MAGAQHTEVFNCTPDEFYQLVTDYEKYPQFLSEVKECKVLKSEANSKVVEYKVSVIKAITYQLRTQETQAQKVSWEFVAGDVFKSMSGSWTLAAEAGGAKTKATYQVEGDFKIFVPGPVAKTLLNVNLPAMMAAYHKRIKEVYGK